MFNQCCLFTQILGIGLHINAVGFFGIATKDESITITTESFATVIYSFSCPKLHCCIPLYGKLKVAPIKKIIEKIVLCGFDT